MLFKQITVIAMLSATASGFVSPQPTFSRNNVMVASSNDILEELLAPGYAPGKGDGELARRFGHLVGTPVKTVGEAFAEFTKEMGYSINALYKNAVTDIVGTTHLITVDARFQKDAIWSAGLIASLDLLLKNYPEKDVAEKLASSFFKCLSLDEAETRAEALMVKEWATGKTKEEVEAALSGEGDSPIAAIAKNAKGDQLWMYSRYFGIGLISIMKEIGVEMDKDSVYNVMEDWMLNKLEKMQFVACSDSDMFFKVKEKLDMMETMMKEIEIREKKRMAERLEEKAEFAIQSAEREAAFEIELAAADEAEAKAKAEKLAE